jgi:hypothetical protein
LLDTFVARTGLARDQTDIWALGRGGDYLLALPVYRPVQWIGVRIGDEVRQGCCVNLSDLRCSRLDPERDGHDHMPVARFPPAVLDRLSQSAASFFYRYS